EMSATGWYAASSAVVSVGSSALVSGIILSPVLLPLNLIIGSVVENKKQKTALITTKSPDNKDIKMQVPLNVVKEGNLKAGDKVTLEKTQEGTGAYLKKEGKVLAHMVNQDDAGLSSNQTVPAK
ncbi:STM0539 family protein, partial [Salmonella enterica]|nr:STM0539 family protein [Salmonella enterica]EIO0419984.1 STM0539 family protein [Salmonella enterica]EJB1626647.1 STM0539 family protein [Salmonella enterica]EJL2012123.1 STM0539 family protein [Salmonella enterica]